MVDKNVGSYAFEYPKEKASSHSKSLDILAGVQTQLVAKRKAYLKENTLTRDDCHLLFKLRSRMLDVKVNFSTQYDDNVICRTCRKVDSVENEDHLLQCENLKSENLNSEVKFDYVYKDLKKQIMALEVYKAILRKREVLLKFQ